jgi:hypothetical protein
MFIFFSLDKNDENGESERIDFTNDSSNVPFDFGHF